MGVIFGRSTLLFQTSLGIQIEEGFLSMVCLKTSFKGVRLAARSIHSLEKDCPVRERLEIVRERVQGFMSENRISSADIFLGIPRNLAIMRYVELPLAVKENLRETLGYEMEKYTPFSANEIYYDYQVIEEDRGTNRLRALLTVVKKDAAEPYYDLGTHLAAGLSGVEICSTAISNYFSLRENAPDTDAFGILFAGDGDLEVDLVEKGRLTYSKYLGTVEKGEDFHGLVLRELRLVKASWGRRQGNLEVVVWGPGADRDLVDRLGNEADIGARMADGTLSRSFALIPAWGLALKGLRKVPMDINLLPAVVRKKASRAGYYAVFVLSFLLLLSLCAWGGGGMLRQRLDLSRLNSEIKRLGADIAHVERVQTECRLLEDRVDYLNELRKDRFFFLDVLRGLTESLPETAWVHRLTFSRQKVQIEGNAASASELISLLDAVPLFKNVGFLSSITKSKDGKEKFRIGFDVSSP